MSQKVVELVPQQVNSLVNPFDDDSEYHGDAIVMDKEVYMYIGTCMYVCT